MVSFTVLLPFIFILISSFIATKLMKKGLNKKGVMISQFVSFLCVTGGSFFFAMRQISADEAISAVSSTISSDKSLAFSFGLLAASLALGFAAIAAGIALASAIPAAIAAMSENEKTFGKSMVFAIFGEAIALYGFLIAILIMNKLELLVG